MLGIRKKDLEFYKSAALDNTRVTGFTHSFYNYPARFSPIFVRETINLFTEPGDLVFDPFMGGGTTLVEARVNARHSLGVDINSLSSFIAKVKTTPLTNQDYRKIRNWVSKIPTYLNTRNKVTITNDWQDYYKNIDCKATWPIRKLIHLAIDRLKYLDTKKQKDFIRCSVLKTAQWALDSRKHLPTADEFRSKLIANSIDMIAGIVEFSTHIRRHDGDIFYNDIPKIKRLHRSVIGLESDKQIMDYRSPKLILTSPPYPGVHMLYHRWQVQGRRETPAPYWIANKLDGNGASYYTFGDRGEETLDSYFENVYESFYSIANIADHETTFVQMVAFSDPKWQLPRYLECMKESGLREIKSKVLSNSKDGRLWRNVPNRKWHASQKGNVPASKEVVLFHKLR